MSLATVKIQYRFKKFKMYFLLLVATDICDCARAYFWITIMGISDLAQVADSYTLEIEWRWVS